MSVKLMSSIFETEFRDLPDEKGNITKASTAKLVLLALADHANDEGEGAYPGLTKMERKTALSRQTIINTYDALKHNGIIYLAGISKRNTNNYSINVKSFPKMQDGEAILLVNQLDQSNEFTSTSQTSLLEVVNPFDPNHTLTINKPSLKTDELQGKYMTIENAIALDIPVTQEMADTASLKDTAPKMFEAALGFKKPLPWWSNKEWTAFAEWVCEEYSKSKTAFGEYNIWRFTPYVKGGIANTRLRGFPAEFYDSWDMFMMSRKDVKSTEGTTYTDKDGIPLS